MKFIFVSSLQICKELTFIAKALRIIFFCWVFIFTGCTASKQYDIAEYDCVSNESDTYGLCVLTKGDQLIYLIKSQSDDYILKHDSLFNAKVYWITNEVIEFKKFNGIADQTTGISYQVLRFDIAQNKFIQSTDSK